LYLLQSFWDGVCSLFKISCLILLSICGHFKEQFYHVGSSNCVTGEFDDLCARSSELAQQSNGAPMFTVAEKSAPPKAADSSKLDLEESVPKDPSSEDDWQML
jgi:hypothetical protein